jgi:hypothetical protein
MVEVVGEVVPAREVPDRHSRHVDGEGFPILNPGEVKKIEICLKLYEATGTYPYITGLQKDFNGLQSFVMMKTTVYSDQRSMP